MAITEARREYLKNYQRRWVNKRRQNWINENGPCKSCDSNKELEVDHKNPFDKTYEPSSIWSLCKEKRDIELAKCQVLCQKCHAKKSALERRHVFRSYDKLRIKSPEGMAWCYVKKHFVHVDNFSKNKRKFDGRQDECRDCRSELRSPKKVCNVG
jgi:hypothetical protein